MGRHHHRLSCSLGKDRRLHTFLNGDGFIGDGRDFRPDNHFDHAILGNEGGDTKNDADIPISHRIDLLPYLGEGHIVNERHRLTHRNDGFLIVARENGGTGKHFNASIFSHSSQSEIKAIIHHLIETTRTLVTHPKGRLYEIALFTRIGTEGKISLQTNIQVVSMGDLHEDHLD